MKKMYIKSKFSCSHKIQLPIRLFNEFTRGRDKFD